MNSPRLRIGRTSMVNHAYLLTTVCARRYPWFTRPDAARLITDLFPQMDAQGVTTSLAWVVMPDHMHWLFQLGEKPLSHLAQRFKSRSALLLNRLHGRSGQIWQKGFHDHCLRADDTDTALRRHARYVIENPVRAGLAERVGDYPNAWCKWPLDATDR